MNGKIAKSLISVCSTFTDGQRDNLYQKDALEQL